MIRLHTINPHQALLRREWASWPARSMPTATKPTPGVLCACCNRHVAQLDGLYGCCDACANCQSQSFRFDPKAPVEPCCHGVGAECCVGEAARFAARNLPGAMSVETIGQVLAEAPMVASSPESAASRAQSS